MPTFIVIGHKVRTDDDFSLNDLAGSTGRLDVLLRCVNSAFMLSNDMRKAVDVYLVLLGEPDPPKTIRFEGSELKFLNPDERSTGALVKKSLAEKVWTEEIETSPGVFVCKRGLAEILGDLNGRRVYLREGGKDVRESLLADDDTFILGGHEDLTAEEERIIETVGETIRVSLGPRSLHADHCITLVLNELDRILSDQPK
jgi:tRNA (pseudouridine54-N1)-methyltransferase